MQLVLDALATPAFVRNRRLDMIAANQLGIALCAPLFDSPARPVNTARFIFLDPRAPGFLADWDRIADEVVATLRAAAGRDPRDQGLSGLVRELSTRSEAFRLRWAAHNVRLLGTGVKCFRHPAVGELTLTLESMQLSADTDLTMAVYTAEPGTPSHEALNRLAGRAAL